MASVSSSASGTSAAITTAGTAPAMSTPLAPPVRRDGHLATTETERRVTSSSRSSSFDSSTILSLLQGHKTIEHPSKQRLISVSNSPDSTRTMPLPGGDSDSPRPREYFSPEFSAYFILRPALPLRDECKTKDLAN